MWAAFRKKDAFDLCGDGPEFAQLCERFDLSAEAMFVKFRRDYHGLVAFPLDWTSHRLPEAITVLVETEGLRRRQVVRADTIPDDLIDFHGAVGWNLYDGPRRDRYHALAKAKARTNASEAAVL